MLSNTGGQHPQGPTTFAIQNAIYVHYSYT